MIICLFFWLNKKKLITSKSSYILSLGEQPLELQILGNFHPVISKLDGSTFN